MVIFIHECWNEEQIFHFEIAMLQHLKTSFERFHFSFRFSHLTYIYLYIYLSIFVYVHLMLTFSFWEENSDLKNSSIFPGNFFGHYIWSAIAMAHQPLS